ncbi:flavodoxin family protein [Kitasatospora hibisci]|uniref:flavodoxin family protein n=1 Tax=Kitasatospora hibisci TaxID=3369522 RepID=UPI00375400AF
MSETITVAIAYHSGYGHTARQAQAVADGVEEVPGAAARLLDVSEPGDRLWDELAAAEAIVFGSPTYMGGPSAVFQTFAEGSSKVWSEQGWAGKLAAGFTTSAGVNGDKLNTLTSMAVFAAQHGMNWVSLGLPPAWLFTSTGSADDLNRLGGFLGAMAQAPSDLGPEEHPAAADLRTAEHLGRRVARTAVELAAGRRVTAAAA